MAEIVVTFSKIDSSKAYDPPVAKGAGVRTEVISFGANGTLTANGETIVELTADADCWVLIGAGVVHGNASEASGVARLLKGNLPYTFSVVNGERVAAAAV